MTKETRKPNPAYVDAPYIGHGVWFIDGEWKEVTFDGHDMTETSDSVNEEEEEQDAT